MSEDEQPGALLSLAEAWVQVHTRSHYRAQDVALLYLFPLFHYFTLIVHRKLSWRGGEYTMLPLDPY